MNTLTHAKAYNNKTKTAINKAIAHDVHHDNLVWLENNLNHATPLTRYLELADAGKNNPMVDGVFHYTNNNGKDCKLSHGDAWELIAGMSQCKPLRQTVQAILHGATTAKDGALELAGLVSKPTTPKKPTATPLQKVLEAIKANTLSTTDRAALVSALGVSITQSEAITV